VYCYCKEGGEKPWVSQKQSLKSFARHIGVSVKNKKHPYGCFFVFVIIPLCGKGLEYEKTADLLAI
jgi:hypothetical protein